MRNAITFTWRLGVTQARTRRPRAFARPRPFAKRLLESCSTRFETESAPETSTDGPICRFPHTSHVPSKPVTTPAPHSAGTLDAKVKNDEQFLALLAQQKDVVGGIFTPITQSMYDAHIARSILSVVATLVKDKAVDRPKDLAGTKQQKYQTTIPCSSGIVFYMESLTGECISGAPLASQAFHVRRLHLILSFHVPITTEVSVSKAFTGMVRVLSQCIFHTSANFYGGVTESVKTGPSEESIGELRKQWDAGINRVLDATLTMRIPRSQQCVRKCDECIAALKMAA